MTLLRLAAIGIASFLAAYQVFLTRQLIEGLIRPETLPAPGFSLRAPWPSVRNAGAAARDAGLRDGDRLLAVQGEPFAGLRQLEDALAKRFPGDRITVTAQPAGAPPREISWQLEQVPAPANGLGRWIHVGLVQVFMPFLCLLLATVTVLARPREPLAWLLFAMLASFAHSNVSPAHYPASLGALRIPFHLLHNLLNVSWPLFMFVFAWEFPRTLERQRRLAWPFGAAVAGTGALIASVVVHASLTYRAGAGSQAWIDTLAPARGVLFGFQMAAIGGYFMLFAIKRSVLDDPDARRRVTAILFGSYVALTPMFALILWSLARGGLFENTPEWAIVVAVAAMALFPVTLAYVVVVQRAFGLKMALRTGLQYVLARRAVRVVQVLLSIAVMLAAFALATQPGMNRPKTIQWIALGVLGIFFLQSLAARAGAWIDRRFFRDAHHTSQVLESLSDEVRSILDVQPLAATVARRLSEALHATRVALLLPGAGRFQPAHALGFPGPAPALDASSSLAQYLGENQKPQRVYFDDETSWLRRHALPAADLDWLRDTGAELLLPLGGNGRLSGIISLGPRRSEEPYSRSDLRLLQNVAVQTSLALENSRLAAQVAEQIAEREIRNREIEIAREVQERLFPQNLPAIPGLDYSGHCRPAKVVGGDSFDFLLLEDGSFAAAIGDVSGKGIPAALLMASLQSALRGQASAAGDGLAPMMERLNRILYDSSPPSHYATLFYSHYDPASRRLTYVNGGHNAPFLIRNGESIRLDAGGIGVGLLRASRYQSGEIFLQPGDLLAGFTDGVSESTNAAGQEWGEEPLGALLVSLAGLPAREIISHCLAAASGFAAGAPQHDDMTMIVVKFLA